MDPTALIGRRIAGRYQLEQLIGRGGFGAVYRATHHPLGRTVAVKVSLQAREGLLARFEREARVQANIRHPGCVFLLDYGQEDDGLLYMVQEFVRGQSLHQLLAIERKLDPFRAIELTMQLLDALDEAHVHGIVHRDIKPGNVMVTLGRHGREEVRVLDFGIAKVIGDEDDEKLTATGLVLGTPNYMAPEQIRQQTLGPATDVYAVGALLYRMLAGAAPFTGESQYDIVRQHMEAAPPSIEGDTFGLTSIIHRAMEKAPGARFATAGQMRAALAVALGPATRVDPVPGFPMPAVLARSAGSGPPAADDTLREGSASIENRGDAPAPAGWRQKLLFGLGVLLLIAAGVAASRGLGSGNSIEPPTAASMSSAPPEATTAAAATTDADAPPTKPAVDATAPDMMTPDMMTSDMVAPDAAVDSAAVNATPRVARRARSRKKAQIEPRSEVTTAPAQPAPAPQRAAKRRTRAQPRAVAPDPASLRVRDTIRSALDRCHCAWALREIKTLARTDGRMANGLESEYTERCVTMLPGVENCLSRALNEHERENSR